MYQNLKIASSQMGCTGGYTYLHTYDNICWESFWVEIKRKWVVKYLTIFRGLGPECPEGQFACCYQAQLKARSTVQWPVQKSNVKPHTSILWALCMVLRN